MNPLLRRYTPMLIGVTGAAALGGYYYTRNHDDVRVIKRSSGRPAWIKNLSPNSFELKYARGPYGIGDLQTSDHLLLSEEDCEQDLKAHEKSTAVARPGNMVVRCNANTLDANSPSEDRYAIDIVPRSCLPGLRGSGGPSFWQRWRGMRKAINVEKIDESLNLAEGDDGTDDLLMFSVLDGHGRGPQVAELLKKVIHPTIGYALGAVIGGMAERIHGLAGKAGLALPSSTDQIVQTIQDVLLALDNDIMRTPLTLLRDHLPDPDVSHLLPHPAPSLVHLADLARAGSCSTTALIDTATDKLYVANIGDCRAVAGWYDPKSGRWRCDVLSEIGDCVGDNLPEAEKCRAAHPEDERETVILDEGYTARVIGESQITRAFGDAQQKYAVDDQSELANTFEVFERHFTHKQPYLTPPYMTAEPEVVTRELHPASGEELKFLVLATDGLWDRLSSEEATHLISGHLQQPHQGAIPKSVLPYLTPQVPNTARPYPAQDLPGTTPENSAGDWKFQDDNAATHLLRNCLGRGDDWERRRLLSMKDGLVRGMRDDMTIIVVMMDEVEQAPDSVQPGVSVLTPMY